jgi:transcriptional regulator
MDRMMGRGRKTHDDRAVLTEAQVREIRRLCARGANKTRLAEMFGTHRTNINNIISGRTWRHVI